MDAKIKQRICKKEERICVAEVVGRIFNEEVSVQKAIRESIYIVQLRFDIELLTFWHKLHLF